eukprot:366471-Chlamydomonas_euryale.AAC.1
MPACMPTRLSICSTAICPAGSATLPPAQLLTCPSMADPPTCSTAHPAQPILRLPCQVTRYSCPFCATALISARPVCPAALPAQQPWHLPTHPPYRTAHPAEPPFHPPFHSRAGPDCAQVPPHHGRRGRPECSLPAAARHEDAGAARSTPERDGHGDRAPP